MYHLIHLETGAIVRRSEAPIELGGELPDSQFAVLVDAVDPRPTDLGPDQTVEPHVTPDIAGGRLVKRWAVVPIQVGPVKKLTIKERVTASEWVALRAVLDDCRKSVVPAVAEIAQEWDDASVIDPANPKTLTVIEQLRAGGILVTPTNIIFAQNLPEE